MKDRKKPYYLILLMPILYALLACVVAWLVSNSGVYPSGSDTMCHIYKGDVLYHAICNGDYWPIYDPLWYNGVEMMRYWAPLPVYVLAGCEFISGGDPMVGYLLFVAFICFTGGLSWLYVGFKVNRPYFGAFLGALWFFMPNNLLAIFYEGNLPRAICVVILPLLMYWVYDYLRFRHWYTIPKMSLGFALTALCHSGYAGMILIAFLIYFLVDAIIYREWRRGMEALVALALGYVLIGVWLIPSLIGGITSMDSSETMAGFFQSLLLSINPLVRLERGCIDFYFGLAAALLAVFGMVFSKRKSKPGFWSGVIILISTSNTMYVLLAKLPGAEYLWMLRFISIALCMILFSFLIWDTLKKGWIALFVCLLVLDALPSMQLVLGNQDGKTPEQVFEEYLDSTLIAEAKEMTSQRLALMDGSSLGATGAYLVSKYGNSVAGTFGAGWQSSATANNIKQINASVEEGNYLYLFDRCMELGNDTVIVQLSFVNDIEKHPIEEMDAAAMQVGYRLVDYNDAYRFYKLDVEGNWGTVTKYRALSISTTSSSIVRQFPALEETSISNLNEFTFEDLCGYDLIIISSFTYDDRETAEQLITDLSEAGVRIVIMADGIPEGGENYNQSFLGVYCNRISFSHGYPNLNTIDGVLDTDLFPNGYRDWNTVYVDGLDEVWGTVEDEDWDLPFYGTVKNDNIVVIGLNLIYYYSLTQDESVGMLLSHAMDLSTDELPQREIVPCTVEYTADYITIETERSDVNTALAYHDSFVSEQEIYSKNNLTYVKEGTTVIMLTYPYLKEGIAVSAAAALVILFYALHMRRMQCSPRRAKREGD